MITLQWYTKTQHSKTFTDEEFAMWVESSRLGVDPTDLDAVYNELDGVGGEEALISIADDRTWVDTSDAEMIDLTEESNG